MPTLFEKVIVTLGLCYVFAVYSLAMVFAVYLFQEGAMFDENDDVGSNAIGNLSYVNQLQTDWKTLPFVDLYATTDWSCNEGDEEIFTRTWYGSDLGCDCLDACPVDSAGIQMNDCYKMIVGKECEGAQKDACKAVDPWPAIHQDQFSGSRLCGVPGGASFLDVQRVSPTDGTCPDGTSPCNSQAQEENIICYPEDQLARQCPINDIQLILAENIEQYKSNGYDVITLSSPSTHAVVYSKTQNRLPITTTKVEYEPCLNPLIQSKSQGELFYATELMTSGCEHVSSDPNFTPTDPRYYMSGLETNLDMVQEANSVLSILEGLPDYDTYVYPSTAKQSYPLRSWNRPTIGWSLQCEETGFTRQKGYDAAGVTWKTSSKQSWLWKLGVTLLVLLSVQGCIATFFTIGFFIKFIKYDDELLLVWNSLSAVFQRLCVFLVVGTFAAVAIWQVGDSLESNQATIDSLKTINQCGDAYLQTDTTAIGVLLDQQKEAIDLLKKWYWIPTFFYIGETAGICVLLSIVLTYESFVRRRYDWSDDFKKFLRAYKHTN